MTLDERLLTVLESARAFVGAHPREIALAGAALLALLLLLLAVRLLGRRAARARARAAGGEAAPLPEERAAERVVEPEAAAGAPAAAAPATPETSGAPAAAEATPSAAGVGAEAAPVPEVEPLEPPENFFQRLRRGLARTQDAFVGRLDSILAGREKLDEDAFEEIEEVLYTADLGVATATRLLERLKEQAGKGGDAGALRETLRSSVEEILSDEGEASPAEDAPGPRVIMFVGVNGVGKTTTIGKVGAQYAAEGKRVMLAAADTFRAAAIEQLEIWGERIGAPVIKQSASSDPSAVAFDAVAAARSRSVDVLLVDTAGRLHTKVNLMEELKKMKRILGRELPGAPHEVILVLDATTGQNALTQARQFNDALGVTGIALTKLDGTAKGGIVIAVHEELGLPIRYIGVGEKVNDLRPFDAHAFVEALFARA